MTWLPTSKIPRHRRIIICVRKTPSRRSRRVRFAWWGESVGLGTFWLTDSAGYYLQDKDILGWQEVPEAIDEPVADGVDEETKGGVPCEGEVKPSV